ncbi:MAG TPA: tetratricopeptide repeat protein [Cyclobacteriaceae bacterium]|nr:tetratricopeptide repeat protein [Cyclobacteriaceae bacterium]
MRHVKKKLLILLLPLLVTAASICPAQEKKADSYQSYKSRSSQSNIVQLLREAEAAKNSNPAQALSKVQEALGMSLAQGDVFNEAKCYLLLGEINGQINEWVLALENFNKAYQRLAVKYSASPEYIRTLRGLGNTNLKMSNYEQALSYYNQILQLKLSRAETAEVQLDISEVYYQQGDFSQALAVLEGINTNQKVMSDALIGKVQNQKAKIYARTDNIEQANRLYQSSQQNIRAAGNAAPAKEEEALKSTKEEISEVLREQKRYDEDITLRNQSIDFNLESKNLDEVSKDKIQLSKSLAAKGETHEAIQQLKEAVTIADSIRNPKDKAAAWLTLATLYENNNRPHDALKAYQKYSEAVIQQEQQTQLDQHQRAELLRKQKEIETISNEIVAGQREEQTLLHQQQLIIYALLAIIAIILVTSYFIYKNAQASKRANQLLALKSLRGQMNPHFIFNALNSVNQFISQNDERSANKYLSEFSKLMRLVLENSQEDFISLQKEEEIISLYVKLEHYRFRDKFEYTISIDESLNRETIQLPPMLIQPYIENAVWHGLRYKEDKGTLQLEFVQTPGGMQVIIADNGIGRSKSAQLKTENQKKHNSTGLKNIQERLQIINTVYRTQYTVTIEDLPNNSGTRVQIFIPTTKNTAV